MGCFLTATQNDLRQFNSTLKQMDRPPTPAEQIQINAAAIAQYLPFYLPSYLKSTIGSLSYDLGKAGEQIAEKVLEQTHNVKITERARAQGVDLRGTTGRGGEVVVEVKTSTQDKPFHQLLGQGYGYKQCSDPWLKHVGVENPSEVRVLGVHIDPRRETVSIFQRTDNTGNSWRCVRRDVPLSEFDLS